LFLALLLRLRGDTEVFEDAASQQVWEQIKVEWPILMGADTLLNLQAILRLVVLLFVSIRAEISGRSPLTGLAALLFLAAALTRGALNTRTHMYRLEGPLSLGGDLAVACELAGVPFLAAIGFGAVKRAPVVATAAVSGGVWFASHHYLNLAKDPSADVLFIQAHVLEFLASLFYAARAFTLMVGRENADAGDDNQGRRLGRKNDSKGNVFVGFMHLLLTVQQAFSAYYFLTAFEPAASLVGSGRPFCVLCLCNLLQLGAYLLSAGLFVGGCMDVDIQPEAAQPAATELDFQSDSEAPTATELKTDLLEDQVDDETEVQASKSENAM
jgi:hypothetical protein